MKTATVVELQHEFPKLRTYLEQGGVIHITEGGIEIGVLLPPQTGTLQEPIVAKPDLLKELEDIYGDYRLSDEAVKETLQTVTVIYGEHLS